MKTSFTNRQCSHIWAQQTQPHGHSSSMRFDGARLYSYSTCIAEIVDVSEYVSVQAGGERKVALLTSNKYSITTSSTHMPAAHSAVANLRQFTVPMLSHAENLKHLEAEYRAYAAKLMHVRDLHSYTRERLTALARDVADYARIFNLPAPVCGYVADYDKAAYRMARLANDPKREAKRVAREAVNMRREAREVGKVLGVIA
jgi:hypothetical protein